MIELIDVSLMANVKYLCLSNDFICMRSRNCCASSMATGYVRNVRDLFVFIFLAPLDFIDIILVLCAHCKHMFKFYNILCSLTLMLTFVGPIGGSAGPSTAPREASWAHLTLLDKYKSSKYRCDVLWMPELH